MRVAICDADRQALEALRIMICKYSFVNQIQGFLSLEGIWEAMETGRTYDVIFLHMKCDSFRDAIDFAAELLLKSPNTQIIYVAEDCARFAQQIFLKPANICGYLVRPIEMEVLEKLLKKACCVNSQLEEKKLIVRQKGALHAIPLGIICYLESRGHQVVIHTTKEKILCYDRLERIKERLPEQFLQCHKSYLVNLDNVRRMERNRIILKTEEEVPISRSRYIQTKETYFEFSGKDENG